jgi:hypothetical protein
MASIDESKIRTVRYITVTDLLGETWFQPFMDFFFDGDDRYTWGGANDLSLVKAAAFAEHVSRIHEQLKPDLFEYGMEDFDFDEFNGRLLALAGNDIHIDLES